MKKLYCNANQIVNIQGVEKLTNLETFYCCYNQLLNLEGLTEAHAECLKEFVPLPNDKLKISEIKRIENMEIACKKG